MIELETDDEEIGRPLRALAAMIRSPSPVRQPAFWSRHDDKQADIGTTIQDGCVAGVARTPRAQNKQNGGTEHSRVRREMVVFSIVLGLPTVPLCR